MMANLNRWCHLLRYHRPGQLAWRLVNVLRRRAAQLTGRVCTGEAGTGLPAVRGQGWAGQVLRARIEGADPRQIGRRAERLLAGRFQFLNQELQLPDPVDWRLTQHSGTTRLWRFHLHYHDYLLDLAAQTLGSGQPQWAERGWDLVAQWIDSNPAGDPAAWEDAWHPYCISRRLPNWILLWSASPPRDELQRRVLESMVRQAEFLARHLERDLGGNHLLENLSTLTLSTRFLDYPGADRWRQRVLRLLQREVAEQILPHGEHFERSPMYHAQMLQAVLDLRDAARATQSEIAERCGEAAARMAEFLERILHPDGQIPLFGDSTLDATPECRQLIRRAYEGNHASPAVPVERPEGKGAAVVGDYWIFRDGGDFLIFDGGPVGADHLPAHAHADLLGFEASVGGRRLFVDGGVFDYEHGPMRHYCRSSAAHNVLAVDDQDQCDMWSRFRMGYRGWPSPLDCGVYTRPGVSESPSAGTDACFYWARAQHNAYRRLGVPTVGRWIACRPGGPWLSVDWADGHGRHRLSGWLHLHPEATATQTGASEVALAIGGRTLRLEFLVPGEVEIVSSWYCPEFGVRLPAAAIRWTAATALPAVCGWSLSWSDGHASLGTRDPARTRLVWRDASGEHAFAVR